MIMMVHLFTAVVIVTYFSVIQFAVKMPEKPDPDNEPLRSEQANRIITFRIVCVEFCGSTSMFKKHFVFHPGK